MGLPEYLTKFDGKISRDGAELARIAAACEVSPYYLYMVARGHKRAGHGLANALETATGGKVKRAEMRPDIFAVPPKAA